MNNETTKNIQKLLDKEIELAASRGVNRESIDNIATLTHVLLAIARG